ncbi:MAG: TetM/TetW/TetO/TetS family tetracycline resistance ribosomal protection protein [Firmicutes bacterium]|nr:TetM/TetW/TetO/TetS family tetracycline resistance ribosomal protection protein [Bacillota bacterium]
MGKNIVLALLAHVDAGKTTMSEALLYKSGRIRTAGRVDHKDAFLDTHRIERERGITIFSKQALFSLGSFDVSLLDTPGHMDFSAEMERTLSVLDCAVLVISGPDGVQAHTETLISLLERFSVPTFVWVNKMDQCERTRAEIIAELQKSLGPGCIDFTDEKDLDEAAAMSCEPALERYLEKGFLGEEYIKALIRVRKVFPCWFGSALKMEGIDEFIAGFEKYMTPPARPESFGARVFKITRDEAGSRLTWMKLTGGSLSVRQSLEYRPPAEPGQSAEDVPLLSEKLTQLRFYSGARYEQREKAEPGQVFAVTGLTQTYAGQGLGFESDSPSALLEPVFSYRILPPPGSDPREAFRRLSVLTEEDPMLRIVWNSRHEEIQAQFMGEVQIEVLKQIILDRFDLKVTIDRGRIMYRETIASPVEGAGHFEPLRHYAEVHLLLEPLPPGSGIYLESACSEDLLDRNWQRLILFNLAEKHHLGVLTGSPLTDVKMTLIAGRAHLKHTEGGDFRQASIRAVRQALMKAENVLLEPYYAFRLQVPAEHLGRAIGDLRTMQARFEMDTEPSETVTIGGRAPVSAMQGYLTALLAYTRGRGKLFCRPAGYFPCRNTEKVVEEIGYDPNRDIDNPADSVFCSHGAGVNVKWNLADSLMHMETGLSIEGGKVGEKSPVKLRQGSLDLDERELQAIMEREFGKSKEPRISSISYDFGKPKKPAAPLKKDYYIVDGYNVIYAWDELKKLAEDGLASARAGLIDVLVNYQAYTGCELILVFDAYKQKDNPGRKEDIGGIHVVYTMEDESADIRIEKLIHEMNRNYSVCVVSSDGLIQLCALRLGVRRMSSRELLHETRLAREGIREIIASHREELPRLGERTGMSGEGELK